MGRFSGMIFDFNGVLWWDSALQEQSWKHFSAGVRGTPFSDEEITVHVHGRNNRHTLEYLTGRPLTDAAVERLTEQKETLYRQLCLDLGPEFRLSPGAEALLDWLAGHGIPRTIATASGRSNVDFFISYLNLAHWFEPERIVCDNGRRPGKPAPDIYLQAAETLGLAPARCVVAEDSHAGIRAACAAGIGYIVALASTHPAELLAPLEGVDVVLPSLAELPKDALFGE